MNCGHTNQQDAFARLPRPIKDSSRTRWLASGVSGLSVLPAFKLEIQLQRQLTNAWVRRLLNRTECAGFDLLEVTQRSRVIHKVGAIEDVEELGAELESPPFREHEVLGCVHVPGISPGQTESVLAGVAESAVVPMACALLCEGGFVEPVHARLGIGASTDSGSGACAWRRRDRRPQSMWPGPGQCQCRKLLALQRRERTSGLGRNHSSQLPSAQDIAHKSVAARRRGQHPHVRGDEAMGVIEVGRAVVKLMAQRIVPGTGRRTYRSRSLQPLREGRRCSWSRCNCREWSSPCDARFSIEAWNEW